MKNIEHVYPQAEAMTADFERQRGQELEHADRVTAYIVFLDLIYNHPRPLTLRILLHRNEEDEQFSPELAAEVLKYWGSNGASDRAATVIKIA
jgi:bacterioferritin (cytochrome b1)